jgi:hypothetical protein
VERTPREHRVSRTDAWWAIVGIALSQSLQLTALGSVECCHTRGLRTAKGERGRALTCDARLGSFGHRHGVALVKISLRINCNRPCLTS